MIDTNVHEKVLVIHTSLLKKVPVEGISVHKTSAWDRHHCAQNKVRVIDTSVHKTIAKVNSTNLHGN